MCDISETQATTSAAPADSAVQMPGDGDGFKPQRTRKKRKGRWSAEPGSKVSAKDLLERSTAELVGEEDGRWIAELKGKSEKGTTDQLAMRTSILIGCIF
jgi:hypothetical protein